MTPEDFPLVGFVFPADATAYQTDPTYWRDRKQPELITKGEVFNPDEQTLSYAIGFRSDIGWEQVKGQIEAEALQYGVKYFPGGDSTDRPGMGMVTRLAWWDSADRRFSLELIYSKRRGNVISPEHDGYELRLSYPPDGKLEKVQQP